jgi:hypothetical protein
MMMGCGPRSHRPAKKALLDVPVRLVIEAQARRQVM